MIRILHTSDWHLGHTLAGQRRHEEAERFLGWLAEFVRVREVNVLVVAGDVFDNLLPANPILQLYYRFLGEVARIPSCRHIVITAGNHDSPVLLEAPAELLARLHIHIVGNAREPEAEVLPLLDRDGSLELIVGAVPFLRERDLRLAKEEETAADKGRALLAGVAEHYRRAGLRAEELREGKPVPFLLTGHLFAAGGMGIDEEGMRELYIGTLLQVPAQVFPDGADYVALGHLHLPQKVAGREYIRYSGSPLPIGFHEGGREKQLLLVDFEGRTPAVTSVPVPVFRELVTVSGELPGILQGLQALAERQSDAWVSVEYTGAAPLPNLRAQVMEAARNQPYTVLRIRSVAAATAGRFLAECDEREVAELDPVEVFGLLLAEYELTGEERASLEGAYLEILHAMREEAP